MKIAYFDCVGGASGDMLLGALADAGVPEECLRGVIGSLHLPECEMRFERVMKGPLTAVQVSVVTPKQEAHRHLGELIAILQAADLSEAIKNRAVTILMHMAGVEAGIHNQPVEDVHLHELGGDDTLIDIAGVLVGLAYMEVGTVTVSPLPLGRGWTDSEVEAELVTPTGAALLTSIADHFGGFPPMTLRKVGCGAGRRDLPFPNVIRLWLGDADTNGGMLVEQLTLLETNIDDMNPQIYAHVMEQLFSAGALDVTLTPTQMKKNRPGVLLRVLCKPEQVEAATLLLFEETTTLGVRRQTVERISLPRTFETVQTPYGPIRVKVATLPSGQRRMPEYEDCRRAAEAYHVPLAEVIAAVHAGSS
jgi:uncharacterized protein (DUF111 family)